MKDTNTIYLEILSQPIKGSPISDSVAEMEPQPLFEPTEPMQDISKQYPLGYLSANQRFAN